MQTFLPYADFRRSAEALDQARLGKQRVETLQMLRALRIPGHGWANHPAVTMWRGHVGALVAYGLAVTEEWVRRGHADTVGPQIAEFAPDAGTQETLAHAGLLPGWLGDESLHRSHRSALVRKDPGHYRPLFGDVPGDLEYVWPEPIQIPAVDVGVRTAWVVRAETPAALGSFLEAGAVAVEPENGAGALEHLALDEPPRRRRKRHEVIERFVDEMAVGDTVVVPAGDRLLVGTVAGDYEFRSVGAGRPQHARTVRWVGLRERGSLRVPSALQNPQQVFPIHDEPDLTPGALP